MYDWLTHALRDAGQVVTANRRLARVLAEEFAKQRIAAGHLAWRSPVIQSWPVWLLELLASAEPSGELPGRINAQQSRVLWERCLRREITDPLLNLAMLVRQARESWARMHEFCVPVGECESAASGKDQRIFARAARSYQSILDREHWVDDAGLGRLVTDLIAAGRVRLPRTATFAGFDRLSPQVTTLIAALETAGVRVEEPPKSEVVREVSIHSYENSETEFRAAGAWARDQLEKSSKQIIAIVATGLEKDAERYARLIREGLAPGWQTSGDAYQAAVNVSYGRKFAAYPAIAVALLMLRWLQSDLTSQDLGILLRTAAIGDSDIGGRSRLDLALRQLPDRNWSPAMVLGVLTGSDGTDSARDWLARVSVLEERRGGLPGRDTPSNWVVLIDDVLKKLNWPGSDSMNSVEFQLVNRWRELLNDLARLQLVVATMTFAEVVARLHTMAGETLFQPELDGALVHLLGPLEAAGLRFGKLWVSGFSATNWPPPGRPSSLISRSVQCSYGMPDATPDDTLDYAQRIWRRLAGSAEQVVCSYPQTDGDIEQSESGLLANVAASRTQGREDPGWHARRLVGHTSLVTVDNDRVPTVSGDEFLSGGAATIQRQFVEPFAAFVFGRLGVRSIPIIISGLTAGLRGSLIHDALHHLYADLPAKREIHSWNESELQQRIESALQESFRRQERHADLTLRQLLQLERARVASLLRAVVAQDLTREDFSVADVEKSVETEISGVRLRLRIDRIDQIAGDQVIVLDYKTGIRKQLLDSDGNPRDMQLVVYARALRETVTAVGLINVDSRGVAIDAIGRDFAPDLDWDEAMADWKAQVDAAADEIRQGDVRINMQQNVQAARPLGLLSRIRELQRDA